jgi:hypothetical protein
VPSTSVRRSRGPSGSRSPSGLAWTREGQCGQSAPPEACAPFRALLWSAIRVPAIQAADSHARMPSSDPIPRGTPWKGEKAQRVVQTAIRCRAAPATLLRRRHPPEVWLRWRADRVKPAADIHLGVGFAAEVPGPGRVGGLGIPAVHRKFGISTLNHKPVDGLIGHDSADFASELLQCCHEFFPYRNGSSFTSE